MKDMKDTIVAHARRLKKLKPNMFKVCFTISILGEKLKLPTRSNSFRSDKSSSSSGTEKKPLTGSVEAISGKSPSHKVMSNRKIWCLLLFSIRKV